MLIKQKSSKIALPNNMDIITMKGTTKIELYNPNTKIKKIYRDENVFQSAQIAKYLRSFGYSKNGLSDYSWQNIVGGLLLFRDEITEGSQFMPEGNRMIGNGSYGVVNNDIPTEMGSYNSVESSASTSAITQVYDFTTAQANGDINCVCLTSATGGYIGYGNPSGTRHATRKDFTATQSNGNNLNGFCYYNNYAFAFDYSAPTLTVTKTRYGITLGSVFDTMAETKTIDLSQLSGYSSNFSINYQTTSQSEGKVYFFPRTGIAISGTGLYLVYDLATETAEFKTLTNSTGAYIPADRITVSHGKAMFGSGSSGDPYYIIDLATSTLYETGTDTYRLFDLTDELSIRDDGYIYDFDNNTHYPSNGLGIRWRYEPSLDGMLAENWYYSNFYNLQLRNNPLYLATINNLDNTVTKTAAQTMKVAYTLTEAE